MSANDYNDPILFKKRSTYVPLDESHQVVNGKIQLQEVPDDFQKVEITSTGTWIETQNSITSAEMYKVDYTTGIITFDSSHNGETISLSYFGTGVILLPISRVYSQETNGEVTETLDQKIKGIDDRIQNMYDWSEHARTEGNYAKTQGDLAKQESERAKELTDDYQEIVYDQVEIWKNYVNAYWEIDTNFPDPKHGWTVMVLEDNTIYRYTDSELKWIPIKRINTNGEVYVGELPPSETNNMWIDLSE